MSELRFETMLMNGAAFPQENPLPPLLGTNTASAAVADDAVSLEAYADRGWEGSMLPYAIQDRYDRVREQRPFKAAVLENEHLKATFMLELGGRLWSLLDKRTGKDLLHVNPVFQPANLAVRDAWFSGGVEWNISIIGHSPFTCAPMFAARVNDETSRPVLRMYEWERVRRVPFQIDCWLSDTSPQLFARVRIVNPHDYTIPMYWWSNIAVDEKPDVRVISPANNAYRHDYDGKLISHDVPIYQGIDVSYPARRPGAADLYFRIPEGQRHWITALNGEGRGLVQTSTERLHGRKMFNWGSGPGGRQWQTFLAEPGHAYIEIQGGLARTQGEYVAMPGKTEWSWLEAYGPLQADPKAVHSANWDEAWREVDQKLEATIPRAFLATELKRTEALADKAPDEIIQTASGWGALERKRRAAAGEPSVNRPAMPFPDTTLGGEQQPWLTLLETGKLPSRDPSQGIGTFMVQPEWHKLLEASAKGAAKGDWLTLVHLGVMRFRANDRAGAIAAWKESIAARPTAYAYRNLAVMATHSNAEKKQALSETEIDQAVALWLKAAELAPQLAPLAIEVGESLLRMGRYDAVIEFVDSRPPEVAKEGRMHLLKAQASLMRGQAADMPFVEAFFKSDVQIANVREKEVSLSELWFDLQAKVVETKRGRPLSEDERVALRKELPPPSRFDFRMSDR
jgi:hypothetical protein